VNLESLAKKTTAQREHPPSRFKSFKIGCGGPIHTEYTIFEDTVPQRTDPFRRVSLRGEVSLDLRIVQPEIGRQLLR